MKKIYLIFNCCMLLNLGVVYSQYWENAIPIDNMEGGGVSLVETTDNSIIAIGDRSNGFGSSLQETVILKLDKEGEVIFTDTLLNSECRRIINTIDENMLLIHLKSGQLNAVLMDNEANLIWEKEYSGIPGPANDVIQLGLAQK